MEFSLLRFLKIYFDKFSVVSHSFHGSSLKKANSTGAFKNIESDENDVINNNSSLTSVQKQLQLLQTAIKQSPGSIIITNQEGEIEYANPSFSRITGYSFEDVIGKNPRFLKSDYHKISFYKELWDTILMGKTWTGQFYNKRKDGSFYWEDATIAPIYTNGKISHFICTKEDVTERKQAEEAIKESEEKFRSFFENTNVNILLLDPESGRIDDANKTAIEYYGYKKNELSDLTFFDLCLLDGVAIDTKLEKILDGSKRMITLRHKLKSGKIKDVEVYPTPVNINNKTLLFTIIQDVTRRKKAIAALTESESKKLALLRIIPDLIMVINRQGKILDLYTDKPSKLILPSDKMIMSDLDLVCRRILSEE